MFRTKKEVDKHVSDILSKIRNENERNLRGYNFAKLYVHVSDFETAKRHLAGFLSIRETYAPAHKLLADIYTAEGNLENALRSFKRSLELDSTQRDVLLKICDLYCRLTCDPDTARYWAERAEKVFPHHETVFRLRECIVNAGGEPNRKELEELIQSELSFRPLDVSLRIKLLKLYLDSERTQEAHDYAVKIEAKRPFPTNIDWYYCFVEICEAYQEEASQQTNPEFHTQFLVVLDHLITLLLAEPHALLFGTDNETLPQHSRSIADVAAALQTFDRQLHKAWKISNPSDRAWRYLLQHMSGQLYLHFATLLLKRAKKDHGNWKEACRIGGALLLVAYSFKPGNLLEESWFPKLGERQQLYTELWQHATKRMTYAGYVIISLCKEDEVKWLHKMKQEVCIPQVQERTYQRLFSGSSQKKEIKDSHFLQDKTFVECSLEFPSASSLAEYTKVTPQLYPSSLHHLTWLALQLTSRKTKLSELNFQVFPTLLYASDTLTHGGPESLCQLDTDAFLYATLHVATLAIEQRRSLARLQAADAIFCVPPDIADPLCTQEQSSWWLAAYALTTNTAKAKHGEFRRILRRGLEVIRGVCSHGMDVSLVVHLARTFADKASDVNPDSQDEATKEKALALSARASHYWAIVINMLDKLSSSQTVRTPRERLFKSEAKDLSLEEASFLREEGKLYLATQKMKAGKLEDAAETFSTLSSAYASFNLAICLKKLAEEISGDGKFHLLSSEQRNKMISLLTRARDSLYLTLDRMRGDKKHPLNANLELEIGEIEAKLLKAERGSVESINSEDSAAGETEEDSSIVNLSPDQNKNLTWLKTTSPRNKEETTPAKRGDGSNSSHKAYLRPSPERLDAQLRSLAYRQDSFVHTILEQQNALIDSNKTLLKEIKEQKTAVEELKKQIEELQKTQKATKYRRPSHGPSSHMRSYNGSGMHNEYDDYDDDGGQDGYYDGYCDNDGTDQNGESEYSDGYGLDHTSYMHDNVPPSNMPYLPHHQYHYGYPPPPAHPSQPLHMGVPFPPPHGPPPPPPRSYMPPPSGHGFPPFSHGQKMPQFRFPLPPHPAPVPLGSSQMPPPPPPHGQSSFGHLEPPPLSSQPGYFSPTPMQSGLTPQQTTWTPKQPLPTSSPHPFQIHLSSASATIPSVPPAILSAPSVASSQPPSFLTSTSQQQYALPSSSDTSSSPSQVLSLLNSTSSMVSATDLSLPGTGMKPQQSPASGTYRASESSTSNGLLPDQSPMNMTAFQKETVSKDMKLTSDEESFEKEHEAQGDFKPVVPLPAEVPVCTGEEGEKKLFESRAKLFRFVEKEWKERGVGTVKLLLNEETGNVRFLMRRDQVLKVGANHYLLPNMALQALKNNDRAWIWAAQDFADEEVRAEKFCIRFKTTEESAKFKEEFDKAVELASKRDSKKSPAALSDSQTGANKEASVDSSKDAQARFVPIGAATDSSKFKGTTWNCMLCHTDNLSEAIKCGGCGTSKPTVIPQDEKNKPTGFIALRDDASKSTGEQAISSKGIPVSSTSEVTPFSFTSASSMLSKMASEYREATRESSTATLKASFGGFTFATPPVVKDMNSSDTSGQREIKIAGVKAIEDTKKGDARSSPFAGFMFPNTKLSEGKSDTSLDKPIFGTTSNVGNVIVAPLSKMSSTDEAKKTESFTKFPGPSVEAAKKSVNGEVTSCAHPTGPEEFVPTKEFQPVVSLPSLVEIKTGEEEEEKLFGEQAKLFRFDSEGKAWKERGVGELKILYNHDLGKSRILMRRDQVLKICANHYILPGMKVTRLPSNERTWMWFANDFSEGELVEEKLAAKFKTVEIGLKFKEIFEKCQRDAVPESSDKTMNPPKDQADDTKPQDLSDKQKKLSEIFKPKEGSWECSVCYVRNDAHRVTCIACEHSRPGVQKPSVSRESDTSIPAFKFGMPTESVQCGSSQATKDKWMCSTCKHTNNSSESACKSCQQPKLSSLFSFPTKPSDSSAPQTFKFGIPTDVKSEGEKTDKSGNKSFGDIFKPSAGTWVCSSCFVHNDSSKTTCAGCEATKPNESIQQGTTDSVIRESRTCASDIFKSNLGAWLCTKCYGQNESDRTDCSVCSQTKPVLSALPKETTPASQQKDGALASSIQEVPLSELFKPSPGSWSCPTCYVRNDVMKTVCAACETPKPGLIPTAVSSSTAINVQNEFGFSPQLGKSSELDKEKTPRFGFTPSAFASTPKAGENTPLAFTSPVQPKESQPSKVQGWGSFSNISKQDTDKQPATEPKFRFGMQPVSTPENASTPSSNKFGPYVFGSSDKVASNAPGTGFAFGSTAFSIGSVNASKPANELSPEESKTSEYVQFRFGSPQKYEFNFTGVRPKSPTKVPKSPGTPSDVSAELTEEVETSEADSIYFPPVLPLPPKIDAKTGEEEEKQVYCQRAKVFRFDSGEWKERGLGDLKILHNPNTGRVRLLMRRDQVLKVCLNHYLTADMEFTPKTEKTYSWAATDFSEGEPTPQLLTVRFKNAEIASSFKEAVDNAKKLIGIIESTKIVSSKSTSVTDTTNTCSTSKGFRFGSSVSPGSQFSLADKFGTSPSSVSRSLFGNVSSTKISEENSSSDDVVVVCQKETTPEKKDMALKLKLPPQFFLYEEKPTCPGCRGCEKDAESSEVEVVYEKQPSSEVEVVYEKQPSPEQVEKAKKLMLPRTFFLYENKPSCPGCRGCRDDIPKLAGDSQGETEDSIPQTGEAQTTSKAIENVAPFGSSKIASVSFADLASKRESFAVPSSGIKSFTFSGAGTPVFGSHHSPVADSMDDDQVAPSVDVHFDPVVPLPALIDVKTGEEEECVLFGNRAKLYRFDREARAWKERGVGEFKILKHTSKNLFRILMRRDQIHKVACNHYITSKMVLEPLRTSSNSLTWLAVDYAEEKPVTEKFAVRFKTKELLDEFKKVFEDCQQQMREARQETREAEAFGKESLASVPASGKEEAAEECNLFKQVQKDLSNMLNPPETTVLETSSASAEEGQESERSVTSEEASADDDDYEDDDDDVMFDKRVSFAVKEDGSDEYKPLGMGVLQILYDDSFFGATILVTDDNGKKLCYHAIAVQTSLRTVKKEAYWSALDSSVTPSHKRHFRATFSSLDAVAEFSRVFEEGKHLAVEAEVVETED